MPLTTMLWSRSLINPLIPERQHILPTSSQHKAVSINEVSSFELFCLCFVSVFDPFSSILGHSSWCGSSDWSRGRPDWINCLLPLVCSTSLRDFISDLESKSLIHCHLEFLKWSLVELISTHTHTCTPVPPFNYQKHRLDRLLFFHTFMFST